jgi:predicted regulator of Ras-like GTPase activity (Roadblock/LC7/MglB family)
LLKQKISAKTSFSDDVALMSVGEENSDFASVGASLAEIRKLKGVIGYILRSSTSAIIDLAESDKISPYAILTSEIHESCVEIAKQFKLNETESVLVEGEKVKVLCLSIGENKISVLMEKSANHAWIIKRILL